MPLAAPLGRRSKLFLEVRKEIEQYIVEEGLRPGDQLPTEPELCQRFGVSRTAVREAIKVLEVLGVVSVEPGRGTYLRQVDVSSVLRALPFTLMFRKEDFREVTEVRRWLELFCVERATEAVARSGTMEPEERQAVQQLLDRLRECIRGMEKKARQGASMWDEDVRFHRLLAEFTDNRVLLMILEVFWSLRERLPQDHSPAALEKRYLRHRRLWEAIASGDAAAARRALEEHYVGAVEETGVTLSPAP